MNNRDKVNALRKKTVKTSNSKPTKKARGRRGRPAFAATEAQRVQVRLQAGFGLTHDQIALMTLNKDGTPISRQTLEKHFARELELGPINADLAAVQSLHQMAVGRPAQFDKNGKLLRDELAPNVGAAIWWTKARLGWKEPPKDHRVGGPDGGPLRSTTLNLDPEKLKDLSDAELDELERRINRIAAGAGGDQNGEGSALGAEAYAATFEDETE